MSQSCAGNMSVLHKDLIAYQDAHLINKLFDVPYCIVWAGVLGKDIWRVWWWQCSVANN